MRQHLTLAALLVAAPALADRAKPTKPKPIDPASMIERLDVYRDDTGMYVIAPRSFGFEHAEQWVFYGDGKTMYQQRVIGTSTQGSDFHVMVWAPRSRSRFQARLKVDGGVASVDCRGGPKNAQPLVRLAADEARSVVQHAVLLPPLWTRTAHFLGRDDDGVYYFVDQLLDEYGGKGHRVYVGQKGAMKELAMKNIVSDSAGELFATKAGDLRVTLTKGKDTTAVWKKGGTKIGKKTELTVLEPQANRYLIYRELGIYGALGTLCDDQ